MKKMDHAHVESALFSGVITVIIGAADYFFIPLDSNPYKVFFYLLIFALIYAALYWYFRKLWNQ